MNACKRIRLKHSGNALRRLPFRNASAAAWPSHATPGSAGAQVEQTQHGRADQFPERSETRSRFSSKSSQTAQRLAAIVFLGLFVLGICVESTAQAVGGRFQNFSTVDTDSSGRKARLKGSDAERRKDGKILIKGLHIETYREGDKLDMIVEAPECIFDPEKKVASSDGPLKVRTADQRFAIAGRGFRWQQLDSSLAISNDVHTVLRKTLLSPTNAPVAGTPVAGIAAPQRPDQNLATNEVIEIVSNSFLHKPDTAIFSGAVRASEPQGELTCDLLTAAFHAKSGGLEKLTAEKNVRIHQGDIEATGDLATYNASEDLVALSGHPRWKLDRREGSSDHLVVNRRTREVRAEKNVRMKLPSANLLPPDFFATGRTNLAASRTNTFVEIVADSFLYRSNSALFERNVHVQEVQSALRCTTLELVASKPNGQPEKMIAEGNVHLTREKNEVRSEKAVFEVARDTLTFSGSPRWKWDEQEGSARRLVVYPKASRFEASEAVHLRVPFAAASALNLGGRHATNALAPAGDPRFLEILAEHLDHEPKLTKLQRNVRVKDAGREMTCAAVSIRYREAGGEISQIIADEDVVITEGARQASGRKVIYDLASGQLNFLGAPRFTSPDRTLVAQQLELNTTNNTFRVKGDFTIVMRLKSTNAVERSP
ncbi:MAG: LptA/OstA family protein [Verrucomicrobiota bacterium]